MANGANSLSLPNDRYGMGGQTLLSRLIALQKGSQTRCGDCSGGRHGRRGFVLYQAVFRQTAIATTSQVAMVCCVSESEFHSTTLCDRWTTISSLVIRIESRAAVWTDGILTQ